MLDIFYEEFVKFVPAYILKREQDTQEIAVAKSPLTATNKTASNKYKRNSSCEDGNFSEVIKIKQENYFEIKDLEVFIND